jgi:hypothetical protein
VERGSVAAMFLACVGIAAACDAYGEDAKPVDDRGDAGGGGGDGGGNGDASATVDGGVDDAAIGLRCTGPFGAAVPVPSLSVAVSEFSMRLSRNELGAYLSRPVVSGTAQMFFALRGTAEKTSAFAGAAHIDGLGTTTQSIAFGSVTPDEKTMVYQRRPEDGGAASLFIARRVMSTDERSPVFENPTLITDFEGEPHAPYLNDNGDGLWLDILQPIVNGPPPTTSRRVIARRGFSPAAPSRSTQLFLELGNDASNPVVSSDELEIFFTRSAGNLLVRATRPNTSAPFGEATILSASLANATASWLSRDSCRLYILIADNTGTTDVFLMSRTPP